MNLVKIYSMIYDSPKYGDNGYGEYLGEFKKIKQLRDDLWVDDFIGVNTETNEFCAVLSREVCGYGGGIAYKVIPIPELTLKQPEITTPQLVTVQELVESLEEVQLLDTVYVHVGQLVEYYDKDDIAFIPQSTQSLLVRSFDIKHKKGRTRPKYTLVIKCEEAK